MIRKRSFVNLGSWLTIIVLLQLSSINAQNNSKIDLNYASIFDPTFLPPFYVEKTYKLSDALKNGEVEMDTRLLILNNQEGKIALNTSQIAWNHVAQGDFNGKNWMVTFCVVCNSGVGFNPEVHGKLHHFEAGGVYNGVIILRDRETKSLWDQISGECISGPLLGEKISHYDLIQTNVKQALNNFPDIQFASADNSADYNNPFYKAKDIFMNNSNPNTKAMPDLDSNFAKTIKKLDNRMAVMDIGLGIWSESGSKFYPLKSLNNDVILDNTVGKSILVYRDQSTGVMNAIYTSSENATLKDDMVILDHGLMLKDGKIFNTEGKEIPSERPLQIFTRWYAFSLAYENCEIY